MRDVRNPLDGGVEQEQRGTGPSKIQARIFWLRYRRAHSHLHSPAGGLRQSPHTLYLSRRKNAVWAWAASDSGPPDFGRRSSM